MELNAKALTTLVITTIIAIVLVSAVLIPITSAAQHAQDVVYTNNNPYSHGDIWEGDQLEEETIIISVSKTGIHTIKINDDIYNVATWQAVLLADAFAIRYYSDTMLYASTSGSYSATAVDITISGGSASVVATRLDGTTTVVSETLPVSWAYIYNPDGAYTAYTVEPSSTAVLYGTKESLYSSNWVTQTSSYFSIKEGVITLNKDGEITHPELNFEGEYLGNGVYSWAAGSGITFDVDNSGSPYTVHPFMICMPREVIGTPDENQSLNTIIGIIPLLVLAGLVIGVVGSFIRNRD